MKWTTELPSRSGWYFARWAQEFLGIIFYCADQKAVYEAGHKKYHVSGFEGEWGDRIEMPVQAE